MISNSCCERDVVFYQTRRDGEHNVVFELILFSRRSTDEHIYNVLLFVDGIYINDIYMSVCVGVCGYKQRQN